MLKVPEDQMSAPQRSDDSEGILQQIQFTQLKATTCVNKKSITFHFNRALRGTHCLRVAHTECTTEDFRRIVELLSIVLEKNTTLFLASHSTTAQPESDFGKEDKRCE